MTRLSDLSFPEKTQYGVIPRSKEHAEQSCTGRAAPWGSVEAAEGVTAIGIAAAGLLRESLFARLFEPCMLDI